MAPPCTYFDPSDQETTPFESVQVPERLGAQQPARNGTMQLVSTGLVGSEQGSPPSPASLPPVPPPVPLELDDELPPVAMLVVVVVVVAPPVPPWVEEDEQPAHTRAAAVSAESAKKERDMMRSLLPGSHRSATRVPGARARA